MHRRNVVWYTALVDDLKLISIDAATGDEEMDAKLNSDINKLITRAEKEREEISTLIDDIYKESSPMDTLALNQVRSYRQDKIVAWQQDFDRLPKPRAPQVDRHGRRASAFGSVRAMWPRKYDLLLTNPHMTPFTVSEAEEGVAGRRRVTGDSFVSSASDASEPEAETTSTEFPADASAPTSESGGPPSTDSLPLDNTEQPASKSDPDSDSTIGAGREEALLSDRGPLSPALVSHFAYTLHFNHDDCSNRVSKVRPIWTPKFDASRDYHGVLLAIPLWRTWSKDIRTTYPLRVYMNLPERLSLLQYLRANRNTRTAEPPPPRLIRDRSKHRHHLTAKKGSTSDFEHSYAANIAPRYLTHSRRSLGHLPRNSRIPGPIGSSIESQQSSRRTSPDKRFSRLTTDMVLRSGCTSPAGQSRNSGFSGKATRGRPTGRGGKDKGPVRPTSSSGNRQTFRRPTNGPGSKVGNIAKHFERINKETERANRRYAVIRGRRARPVASARAKVEILESVKDAIRDESESSDSSSEADDEGGDEDDGRKVTDQATTESSPEASSTLPVVTVQIDEPVKTDSPTEITAAPAASNATSSRVSDNQSPPSSPVQTSRLSLTSLPPSPFLSHTLSLTPPASDMDIGSGTERNSIFLKALSGFWPQQLPPSRNRVELDGEDPMSDPEHIFRDSSMVVRIDEPTSIIALALKYVKSPLIYFLHVWWLTNPGHSSSQYRDMLKQSRAEKRTAREASS